MISFGEAIYRIYKKSKYIEVQGTCIYVRSKGLDKKCGYQYKYNDYVYEYYDKYYYTFFKSKKGNRYKLFINPDNPNECLPPSYIAISRDLIILGICFLVLVWV